MARGIEFSFVILCALIGMMGILLLLLYKSCVPRKRDGESSAPPQTPRAVSPSRTYGPGHNTDLARPSSSSTPRTTEKKVLESSGTMNRPNGGSREKRSRRAMKED